MDKFVEMLRYFPCKNKDTYEDVLESFMTFQIISIQVKVMRQLLLLYLELLEISVFLPGLLPKVISWKSGKIKIALNSKNWSSELAAPSRQGKL